jgi:inward rectifier potassium channel
LAASRRPGDDRDRRTVAKAANTQESDILVVGARAHPLRDAYHLLLRMRWVGVLGGIAALFLLLNLLFACAYLATGGVVGVAPGSLRDAFFFSVQTMGTIGYGAMYPATTAAHTVVVGESIVSLIMTALATGIVFARFSQSTGQIVFTSKACISPMNGVPTLAFRVGNDRSSTVFEAHVRVSLIRTEKTTEGVTFYRLYDLELSRDRSPVLARSWTVMHPIDEKSPLRGASPEACRADELELAVTVVGTDDTSLQPVHGRRRYLAGDIVWGARLADVLSELPNGKLQLDVRKFDTLVPTEPTASFPYPKPS